MARSIQFRDFFRRQKPTPPLNQRLLAVYMANAKDRQRNPIASRTSFLSRFIRSARQA
jgi:hypothetical protein